MKASRFRDGKGYFIILCVVFNVLATNPCEIQEQSTGNLAVMLVEGSISTETLSSIVGESTQEVTLLEDTVFEIHGTADFSVFTLSALSIEGKEIQDISVTVFFDNDDFPLNLECDDDEEEETDSEFTICELSLPNEEVALVDTLRFEILGPDFPVVLRNLRIEACAPSSLVLATKQSESGCQATNMCVTLFGFLQLEGEFLGSTEQLLSVENLVILATNSDGIGSYFFALTNPQQVKEVKLETLFASGVHIEVLSSSGSNSFMSNITRSDRFKWRETSINIDVTEVNILQFFFAMPQREIGVRNLRVYISL